ncbi:trans-sialidase [Trypanosoma cruzi]|nr:trans-sialidase [Trypanosoma cruzi]
MLLLQLVLAAASLRGHEEKEGGDGEIASRLSYPVGMLHGVWRYCPEAPHHHARGLGMEWRIFFLCLLLWVWVCLRRTCRPDGRSVWLPLSSLGEYATTLSIVCCLGDNVLVTVRLPDGGRGVEELRGCSGQGSRWASRRGGPCPPSLAPLLSGILYHYAAS